MRDGSGRLDGEATLMALAALVLGIVALLLWAFAVAAGTYAVWNFVYRPWQVMRKDLAALDAKLVAAAHDLDARLTALDEFTRPSRIQHLTPEEMASRERRYRQRRADAGLIVP